MNKRQSNDVTTTARINKQIFQVIKRFAVLNGATNQTVLNALILEFDEDERLRTKILKKL